MHEPMDDLDSAKPLKHLFRGFKYPLQKVPVRDHAFRQIDDATRIYYKPYDCESGERGFHAEIVAMDCDPCTSEDWENKNYQFAIGYASAVFDGIRALQLGEVEDGVIHYPDSPRLVAVLAALSDLVRDHCSAPVDRSLPVIIGNAGISHFLTLARNSTSRRCRTQHSIVSGKLVPAQFSLIALS